VKKKVLVHETPALSPRRESGGPRERAREALRATRENTTRGASERAPRAERPSIADRQREREEAYARNPDQPPIRVPQRGRPRTAVPMLLQRRPASAVKPEPAAVLPTAPADEPTTA
jgi:hypothetical protein